jgi:ribosome-associated translation inhibitor RaiA
MDLIIKSLAGQLEEDEKKVIRKKLLWFDEHLPNNSSLTVGIKQHITKKSNQAYEIIIHLYSPKMKRPVYVRVVKNSLADAVDIVREKIERIVLKKKGKRELKFKIKFPKLRLKRANENS